MKNNIKKISGIKLLILSLALDYCFSDNFNEKTMLDNQNFNQKTMLDNQEIIKIKNDDKKNNRLLYVSMGLLVLAIAFVIVIVVKKFGKDTSIDVLNGAKNGKHTSTAVFNGATNGKNTSTGVFNRATNGKDNSTGVGDGATNGTHASTVLLSGSKNEEDNSTVVWDGATNGKHTSTDVSSNTANGIIGKAQTSIDQGDDLNKQENIEQKIFVPLYSEENYKDIEIFSDTKAITKKLNLPNLETSSTQYDKDRMYSAQIKNKIFHYLHTNIGINIPNNVMQEIESYKNNNEDNHHKLSLLDKKSIAYHNIIEHIIEIGKDSKSTSEFLINPLENSSKNNPIVFFEENSRMFFFLHFYEYKDKNYVKLYFQSFIRPYNKYVFSNSPEDDAFDRGYNGSELNELALYQKEALKWFGIHNKKEFDIAFTNFEIEAYNNINQLIKSLRQCKENNDSNPHNKGTQLSIKLNGRPMRVKHFFQDGNYNTTLDPISVICFPDEKND